MEILNIKDLTFTYPNKNVPALFDVNLSVEEGSFNVLCGGSGCGKTTLLKMIKRELSPMGERRGDVLFEGDSTSALSDSEAASLIGYVAQNTEDAIVTDTVWRELCFGLESIGVEHEIIRRRVAETASYFGINDIYRKKVSELSGGEKQLLSLASVLAMQPKLLLLDEPTSKLDPINAAEFVSSVKKINSELGITVIIAEHRLEDVVPIADNIIFMNDGRIELSCAAREFPSKIRNVKNGYIAERALPVASRLFSALEMEGNSPLTVNEGRKMLSELFQSRMGGACVKEYSQREEAVSICDVCFRYSKGSPDVLSHLSLSVGKGERFFVLGGNGAGKTTLLRAVAGLIKPYKGRISVLGKKLSDYKNNSLYRSVISYLPQEPIELFTKSTVREDAESMLKAVLQSKTDVGKAVGDAADKLGVAHLLDKHPFDLSGGEIQKCALMKVMLTEPSVILLDEPTKGLDACAKEALSKILSELSSGGVTTITVSHDLDFAAENADRCALFFDGEIVSPASPEVFFSENSYYTTASSRMSRHVFDNAVTLESLLKLCRDNMITEA